MKKRGKLGIRFLQYFFVAALVLGAGYLVFGTLLLPSDRLERTQQCEQFQADWTLIREDGTKSSIQIPGNASVRRNEVVTIEAALPEKIDSGVYLCYWSLRQDIKISIDGTLRQEYSTKDTRLFGKTSSAVYVFVKLLPEDAGKTIAIESQSDSSYSGVFRTMYIGDRLSIWEMIFQKYRTEVIIGFLLLVLSVIGIIGGMILRCFYHKTLGLEHLSWGVLLAAVWVLGNSVFRQMLFPNISVASDITFYCVMLLPMPFLLYMNDVQNRRYQFVYAVSGTLTAVDLVVCTLLEITNQKDFSETVLYMQIVCGIAVFSMIGTILIDIFLGKAAEYRLTALGLLGAFLAAVIQIILYSMKLNVSFSGTMMAIGLSFLLAVSAISTVRDALHMEQEKHQAEAASESKARFLASMSHEIRTPINAVLGMDEIILRECKQENIREYALNIQAAGRNLLALINDILDFSKIESGKMKLVPVEYELSSLMNDCYQMIQMRAMEKNLTLSLENNSSLPKRLLGDEVRIRQIIINLLTNAVKYTKQGSVLLFVDGLYRGEGDFWLQVIVRDTGIGIKEEDQEKLFESFERVEEEKNRNIEGTGLGLSITKQLVDLMEGTISVESVYGEGSSFIVEIPQKIISQEAVGNLSERYASNSGKETAAGAFWAPKGKILVVDDVEMNHKVIVGLLQNTGLQIDSARSGEECLAKVQQKEYHVIFLDHMMPGMDGIQTFHEMEQLPFSYNRKTPVIMLTANAILGAKEEYLDEGFAGYLSKPIDSSALDKVLLKYLPKHLVSFGGSKGQLNGEEKTPPKSWMEQLTFLDVKAGLQYCAESEEVYRELLESYVREAKDEILDALYQEEDWENYQIEVHGVKSSSLYIGADALSQKAKQLEFAARDKEIAVLRENHEELLREYKELLEKLRKVRYSS